MRSLRATPPPPREMSATERVRRPLRALTRAEPGRRSVQVPEFAAGDRLDGFLVRHGGIPERSRAEWQRLIELAAIELNGHPSKPSQRVAAGDLVQIADP